MSRWQEILIDDSDSSGRVFVEVEQLGRREQVGSLDALPISQITGLLSDISGSIFEAMKKASPSKSSVELGIEVGIENGALVAMIAKGTGKANFKVTMEWSKDED